MTNSRPISPSSPPTTQSEHTEMKNPAIAPVLQRNIQKAARSAKSDLAKYIFEEKNQSYFIKLFATKSPDKLVIELNKINLHPDRLKQFQIFTSKQNEYAELFDLPPEKWMAILIEEKLNGEDLAALIGNSELFEGAVSGILNLIKDIPSPVERANILFYLNNSADANDKEITEFFKKYETQEFNNGSFLALHHILHNVLEKTAEGYTRHATEGILRIKPITQIEKLKAELSPEDQARIKAALRIMRECVNNLYDKAFVQLTKEERIFIQTEQDAFLAKQLDAKSAKQLNQQLNGELSARNITEESSQETPHFTMTNLENLDITSLARLMQNNDAQTLLLPNFRDHLPSDEPTTQTMPHVYFFNNSNLNISSPIRNLSSLMIMRELTFPQHLSQPSPTIAEQKSDPTSAMEFKNEDEELQYAIAQSLAENSPPRLRAVAHSSIRSNEPKDDDEMEQELQQAIALSFASENHHTRRVQSNDFEESPKIARKM